MAPSRRWPFAASSTRRGRHRHRALLGVALGLLLGFELRRRSHLNTARAFGCADELPGCPAPQNLGAGGSCCASTPERPDEELHRELLPGDVLPERYVVQVELDPEKSEHFRGLLGVALNVVSATSSITLNARNLSIHDGSVIFQGSGSSATAMYAKHVTNDPSSERITLQFDSELPVGPGNMSLAYSGKMGSDMAGLYRSKYRTPQGWKHLALTQFEAVDARRMFPCWDEPSKKAVFALSVTVPDGLTAVSNMPTASEITLRKHKRKITFLDTPKMSTYLLALAVGQFDSIQRQASTGTLIRVLTIPGQAQEGQFALDVAVRALEFYEQYFEVPYPLPKLDMLAAPDFAAGAMENWGLVIYREVDLLCNASTVGVARKMRIATVVTHELAHMWFGNLVTMEWWEQLWLNEGFANWMQTHAADVLFPEWAIWEQYVVQEQSRALALDALRSSHSIEVPIRFAQEVDEVFDAISYSKGGSVVRMVNGVLGEEAFRSGLVLYMKRFAYKNTESSDLWGCWEEVSGMPIRAMMNSWTRQQGFPVLVVDSLAKESLRGADSQLQLTQRWFLADGSSQAGDDEKLWHIPLQPGPLAEARRSQKDIFDKKETVWKAPRQSVSWLKFNFGQVAPYRVLYSSATMRASLAAAVRAGEVSAADRVGLLLDSLAFARQGSLPIAELLCLLSAFRAEDNAHVWEALAMVISVLQRSLAVLKSKSQKAVRLEVAIVEGLIRPALVSVGWKGHDGSDLGRQKQALVLALAARFLREDAQLAQEARRRYDAWLGRAPADTDDDLPDDLKTSVFRIVLSNAEGDSEYRALRKHAMRTGTSQAVRLSIYTALGAARSSRLRKETLDMAVGKVRLQDVMYPLQGVAVADPEGAHMAWQWFIQRRETMCRRLQSANVRLLGAVIESSSAALPERDHADEVERLFAQHPVAGLERSIAQIVEAIRNDAQFVARFSEELSTPGMEQALADFEV